MEKITYMGKQLWPKPKIYTARQINGQYRRQYSKYPVAIVGMMAMGGLMFSGTQGVTKMVDNQKEESVKVIQMVDLGRLERKIAELKTEVVETIAKCESGGRNEEDGIVVLDSNNVGSYGVMQWQRKSVMHYYEKRYDQKISGRDAILLALNAEKAKDLAEWVIFETPNGWRNWIICSQKNDIASKVGFIKILEK